MHSKACWKQVWAKRGGRKHRMEVQMRAIKRKLVFWGVDFPALVYATFIGYLISLTVIARWERAVEMAQGARNWYLGEGFGFHPFSLPIHVQVAIFIAGVIGLPLSCYLVLPWLKKAHGIVASIYALSVFFRQFDDLSFWLTLWVGLFRRQRFIKDFQPAVDSRLSLS